MSKSKFDIAISFLSRDISLARSLNDLLSPHFSTFLYERNQEIVAGTDGMETFRTVFRHDSSLNVVLYRDGYGETPWTRVESTAIQEKALEKGWSTVVVVGVEAGQRGPIWLPQNRIFSSAEFGVNGIASVVIARAREIDISEHVETPVEMAARLHRIAEEKKRRLEHQNSFAGIARVKEEVAAIYDLVESLINEIAPMLPEGQHRAGRDERRFAVRSARGGCDLLWDYKFTNSLDGASLTFRLLRGFVGIPKEQGYGMRPPDVLSEREFTPSFGLGDQWIWTDTNPRRDYSSKQLANEVVSDFVRQFVGSGT